MSGPTGNSNCSGNSAEFSLVGFEEVFESLRTPCRDGGNCIGDIARIFIVASFR